MTPPYLHNTDDTQNIADFQSYGIPNNNERRKSSRVSLPCKIRISESNPLSSNRKKTLWEALFEALEIKSRKPDFIEGELEDISSGGALIKIQQGSIRRLYQGGNIFFQKGSYLASTTSPLRVELKTPSGAHITSCDFYVKRLKISGDFVYLGGEFARCDGRSIYPLPNPVGDSKNALVISW